MFLFNLLQVFALVLMLQHFELYFMYERCYINKVIELIFS